MNQKLKVSFWEKEVFSSNRDYTGVKGYEPAKINDGKEVKRGRVLDVEALSQAKSIDLLSYETLLPLEDKDTNLDLSELLSDNERSKNWLTSFKKYFSETFNEDTPTGLSINFFDFPIGLEYQIFPKDIKMVTLKNCPKGRVISQPAGAICLRVTPPMKFSDGNYIPNLYYNRKLEDPNNFFGSYSVLDPTKEHYHIVGSLFGGLNSENVKNIEGDLKNALPLEHFLEVAYPVTLRQAFRYRPLTIRFELKNN